MSDFITESEAASKLQLQSETLKKWRQRRKGPRYFKVGGRVRYKTADLDAFIEASAVDPTPIKRTARRRSR